MSERVLTIEEAAAELGVSRRTVWRMALAGILPAYRVGLGRGHWRINQTDLDRWTAKRKRQSRPSVAR